MINHTTFDKFYTTGDVWATTTRKNVGSQITISKAGRYLIYIMTRKDGGYSTTSGYQLTVELYVNGSSSTNIEKLNLTSYPNYAGNQEATGSVFGVADFAVNDKLQMAATARSTVYNLHNCYLYVIQIA